MHMFKNNNTNKKCTKLGFFLIDDDSLVLYIFNKTSE